MGRSVARSIAQQPGGRVMEPVLIDDLCYMRVNLDPLDAISVQFDDYRKGPDGHPLQT